MLPTSTEKGLRSPKTPSNAYELSSLDDEVDEWLDLVSAKHHDSGAGHDERAALRRRPAGRTGLQTHTKHSEFDIHTLSP